MGATTHLCPDSVKEARRCEGKRCDRAPVKFIYRNKQAEGAARVGLWVVGHSLPSPTLEKWVLFGQREEGKGSNRSVKRDF